MEKLIIEEKEKHYKAKPSLATRQCSMMAIEKITALLPNLIGGSADLSGSNNTKQIILKLLIVRTLTVTIFITVSENTVWLQL